MYRWCSRCNAKRDEENICLVCNHKTDIELDIGDTLRIDGIREFKITHQLSHSDDAGMASVYRVERTDKPEMNGAIKVAKLNKVAALKREAEVLHKLQHGDNELEGHPNIIRLTNPKRAIWQDRKYNETLHFFGMEYMEGGSLKDLLKKRTLFQDEAISITLAVGSALKYAHQQKFTHLDVKPANILFDRTGRVVLSDFGIARDALQLQDLKKRVGTLFYNSPEQLTSKPQHTHQADIYALGVLLYEMLVGPELFRQHRSSSSKSDSKDANLIPNANSTTQTLQFNLPLPQQLMPEIMPEIEGIILKATAKDLATRYNDVQIMMDDLMNFTHNSQPTNQNKLLLIGVGAIALILIGIGAFSLSFKDSLSLVPPTPTNIPSPTIQNIVEETPTPQEISIIIESAATISSTLTETLPSQAGNTVTPFLSPTITRAPTPSPTPTPISIRRVLSPTPAIAETKIELIAPDTEFDVSAKVSVNFQWIWSGGQKCQKPPEGYAFEIRVQRDIEYEPVGGMMDAAIEKQNIQCDPNTGIYSFIIGDIRAAAKRVTTQADGRYRWDVALVQPKPYKAIIISQYRTFYY